MWAAIPKLERRIQDFEAFDIATVRERWDPKVSALTNKINSTLQEIVGHDTVGKLGEIRDRD